MYLEISFFKKGKSLVQVSQTNDAFGVNMPKPVYVSNCFSHK